MNRSISRGERAAPRWPAALLVLGLTVGPPLVPLFGSLRAAEPAATDAAPGEPLVTRNDHDDDGIVDTVDIDDDNDGVPDVLEIVPHGADRDSDGDGRVDRLDLDSDNDGIVDWREAGAGTVIDLGELRVIGGRLTGEVGENGLIDRLESPPDSGHLAYTLLDSDDGADAWPDLLDLDSDNDGLPDLVEAGVAPALDRDRDARIDAPPGSVGSDGIADHLQVNVDRDCCDVTGDGVEDELPRDTDGTGVPDYRDLDSDNDGVNDLVEMGGADRDGDGRVDGFVDADRDADGLDDALLLVPLVPSDENGNGLVDHLDPFAPDPAGGTSGAIAPQPEPESVPGVPPPGSEAAPAVPGAAGLAPDGPEGGDATLDDPVAGEVAGASTNEDDAADAGAGADGALPLDDGGPSVRVGLNGAGCSIGAVGDRTGGPRDPTLALVLLLALAGAVRCVAGTRGER